MQVIAQEIAKKQFADKRSTWRTGVEHLGCVHLLAIVNDAAMSICVWRFLQELAFYFLRYTPSTGIVGVHGNYV